MQASDDFLTYIVSRRHAQSKWALRLDLLLYMTRTASNVPHILLLSSAFLAMSSFVRLFSQMGQIFGPPLKVGVAQVRHARKLQQRT